MSEHRAAEDAATCFRRAIATTGAAPTEVMTDGAAAYPPALTAVLSDATHETSKLVQQRIERDHQHRTGRVRGMRGFKTMSGARVVCRAHAFLRNIRGGFYDLGATLAATSRGVVPAPVAAWDALTADVLTW